MARTYPLSVASFWDLIVADLATIDQFSLGESRQFNVTGAGQIIDANLGTRLWASGVALVPKSHHSMSEIEAQIEVLLEAGASFMAYDPRKLFPAKDAIGRVLGAASVTLSTVNANNRDIALAGLPSGYVLTAGDMFSFSYLSSPTRYALHRVVVGGAATTGGVASVEVTPPIRAGYTLGAAVALSKPQMLAKIVPGSYQPSTGSSGRLSSGLSFKITQSLRP